MAAERKRTRVHCKIDDLPPNIRQEFEVLLSNSANTFTFISDWLKSQDFDISRGAVQRYSHRTGEDARRVEESLRKTEAILEAVERNPNLDITKATQALLADGLMQRMATADDEFLSMSLENAGKLIASLRRVDIADRKLQLDQRRRIELAFDGLEEQLMTSVKSNPELAERMRQLLIEAKAAILSDENR